MGRALAILADAELANGVCRCMMHPPAAQCCTSNPPQQQHAPSYLNMSHDAGSSQISLRGIECVGAAQAGCVKEIGE